MIHFKYYAPTLAYVSQISSCFQTLKFLSVSHNPIILFDTNTIYEPLHM
jgi:hypothetical protein